LPQQRPARQEIGIAVVGGRHRLDQALRPGGWRRPQPDRERKPRRYAGVTQTRPDTHWITLMCGEDPTIAGAGFGSPLTDRKTRLFRTHQKVKRGGGANPGRSRVPASNSGRPDVTPPSFTKSWATPIAPG